jgi:hypothetical protein
LTYLRDAPADGRERVPRGTYEPFLGRVVAPRSKPMRKLGLMAILSMLAIGASAQPALAVVQFQNVFLKEYIDKHENKEFAKSVKEMKVKCLICHQGKKRTNHNPYGIHLVELLDRKKDLKDVEKIKAALDKVAKMHSDPKDEKSPTYGELIAAGKLPGGELEEVEKEPEAKQE